MSRFRGMIRMTLAVLTAAGVSRGLLAEDTVSPLSLVGADAAVCLEVPHFKQTWNRFNESRLASRLKSFPPVVRLLSGPGFQKWKAIEEYARIATGRTVSDQLLNAFAESIVVAVYLPDGGRPQGVLFGQGQSEEDLTQALQSWSTLDPNHVAQVREHQGHSYTRRAKSATSSEVVFYATFGRMIALSDEENLIREVIDFHAAATQGAASTTAGSSGTRLLTESSFYAANRVLLPGDGAAFLFLNTQRWARVLDIATNQSADSAPIRMVLRQLSALSLSLRLDDEVVADVVAEIAEPSRTSEWKKFAVATHGMNGMASRIPADAIAAVSGRLDVRPLIQWWLAINPDSKTRDFARGRKAVTSVFLGRDPLLEVLPALLRDWTISISAVKESSSSEIPVELTGRFSLEENVGRNLDNALQVGINLAAAYLTLQSDERQGPIVATGELTEMGQVRSLAGLSSWGPSYLLGPKTLVVASTRSAAIRSQSDSKSATARLSTAERRYFTEASQLVWLDGVRLKDLLAGRDDWIARHVAPDSTGSRERVKGHLARVGEILKLFDAAFVAAKFEEGYVRLTLGAALDRVE